MPTDKPRITITMTPEQLQRIDDYRFENRLKNQTQAILSLIETGLADLEEETKKSPDTAEAASGKDDLEADSLRSTLLHNFEQLNREGREKLVDTSDDMVSSGKYIKSDPAGLGQKQA